MKQRRLEMPKRFIIEGINWRSVIFSDEKYFALNEFDAYYCWIYKDQFIFQQDNCQFLVFGYFKKKFMENNIRLLQWPPYSPDLNIIENIWLILSNYIYSGEKIRNLRELKDHIKCGVTRFNETQKSTVDNLYTSIQSKLVDVIIKRGDRLIKKIV